MKRKIRSSGGGLHLSSFPKKISGTRKLWSAFFAKRAPRHLKVGANLARKFGDSGNGLFGSSANQAEEQAEEKFKGWPARRGLRLGR